MSVIDEWDKRFCLRRLKVISFFPQQETIIDSTPLINRFELMIRTIFFQSSDEKAPGWNQWTLQLQRSIDSDSFI